MPSRADCTPYETSSDPSSRNTCCEAALQKNLPEFPGSSMIRPYLKSITVIYHRRHREITQVEDLVIIFNNSVDNPPSLGYKPVKLNVCVSVFPAVWWAAFLSKSTVE